MKKIIAGLLLCSVLFLTVSCSQPKSITFKDGTTKTVAPYGIINEVSKDGKKRDDVTYTLSVNDIILSVIFSETIIVPIISLGYNLWEPVAANE